MTTVPSSGRTAFLEFDSKNGFSCSRVAYDVREFTDTHFPARAASIAAMSSETGIWSLASLVTLSERAKLLRRVEQALLPGGGPYDVQPAQMAAGVAGDDDDRLPRRLEPAEPRRLALRRLIQALLADLVEERVRLGPQLFELLHDFVERRVVCGVIGGLAAPVEQRLPVVDRIGRPVQHLVQAALDHRQVPGNPHRVISTPR